MAELVLHHYGLSVFSEKIRLAFGLKALAWWSVETPPAMPKPDLTPLTGGYRRAPVLQIGADVFCDTQLILRELERRHPTPSLFPGGCEGEATAFAWWSDRFIFPAALGVMANINPALFPPDFVREREPFGFILAPDKVRPLFARYRQQLAAHLATAARCLGDGRSLLFDGAASAADLALHHPIWFLREHAERRARELVDLTPFDAWFDRVRALGHGRPTPLDAADALAIARDADPVTPVLAVDQDPTGLAPGSEVTVTADDTGRDAIKGTLVAATADEIVIRHENTRVGAVNLHFPRAGFDVAPA